ncbi:unnamed protein product [Caenorhabditis brenneri]
MLSDSETPDILNVSIPTSPEKLPPAKVSPFSIEALTATSPPMVPCLNSETPAIDSSSCVSPLDGYTISPPAYFDANWAETLRKISEPIAEKFGLPSCASVVPGLFFHSLSSPQGFSSLESINTDTSSPLPTGATNTPIPIGEIQNLVNSVTQDDPEKKVEDVLKLPRLTANGKRIGRPPGTTKVSMMAPRVEPKPIEYDEPMSCLWGNCRQQFRIQTEFHRHVALHHNTDSRACFWEGCNGRTFAAHYMLQTHIRIHTKEKPHRCEYKGCGKEYSRLENLKTHRRTHTGEKPYKCEIPHCTKEFTNASDRAKHQNRTHSDAKPYRCHAPDCGKAYTDPSSLRKHFKSLHKELLHTYLPLSRREGNAVTRKRISKVCEVSRVEAPPAPAPMPILRPTPIFPPLHGFPTPPHMNYPMIGMPPIPVPQYPAPNLPLYNPLQLPISNPLMPMPNNLAINPPMAGLSPTFMLPQAPPMFNPMSRFHPVFNSMANQPGSMQYPMVPFPPFQGFPMMTPSMIPPPTPFFPPPMSQQPILPTPFVSPSTEAKENKEIVFIGCEDCSSN